MTRVPITLRRADAPVQADAWFLTGDDAHVWLRAICDAGLALSTTRLYVVPHSPKDRRAAGVVVLAEQARESWPRALALHRVGTKLFVPADATLHPPADGREIDVLLTLPVNLMHPSCGLVGFEEKDALRVSDLVLAPVRRPTRWDRARPGVRVAERLLSVEAEIAPVTIEFLAADRGDIATKDPRELKPTKDESRPRPRVQEIIARAILAMTANVRRTARQPTWINHLESWAGKHLYESLSEKRKREIERLLRLMDSDPDEGLRFALPLTGDGSRGVARPGGQLSVRTPEFNLRGRGAKPGDNWDVDPGTRAQLIEKYRAQANREIALGRHRRAAYIFAELMGDYAAAAMALERGGHFREAAVLYRERLKNRIKAAECLESGGLWNEALAEWRAIGSLDREAGLLEKLERFDEARAVHKERVQLYLRQRNPVGAAMILEKDLHDIDGALSTLQDGTADSVTKEACIDRLFDLYGRHGRHVQARRWIEAETTRAAHDDRPEASIRGLAVVAGNYPERDIQSLAADSARVLIGRSIESSGIPARLMDVLAGLAPEDAILRRDAVRFADVLRKRRPKQRPPARGARIESLSAFQTRAVSMSTCSALVSNDHVFVLDGNPLTGRPRFGAWSLADGALDGWWEWKDAPAMNAPYGLGSSADQGRVVLLIVPPPGVRGLAFHHQPCRRLPLVEVGTPDWMPADTTAVAAHNPGFVTILRAVEGRLVLSGSDIRGNIQYTLDVGAAGEPTASSSGPLVALEKITCVATPNLSRTSWQARLPELDPPIQALRMVASPPRTFERLVVVTPTSCILLTHLDRRAPARWIIDIDSIDAHATFTRSGLLVLVHSRGWSVHDTGAHGARSLYHGERTWKGDIVLLAPGIQADEFVILTADGTLERHLARRA